LTALNTDVKAYTKPCGTHIFYYIKNVSMHFFIASFNTIFISQVWGNTILHGN